MPRDYVERLAEEAFRKAQQEKDKKIVALLLSAPETASAPDAAALANQLNSRPDLQAQLASLTGYTPSKWLLACELEEVVSRRDKLGFKEDPSSNEAQAASDPFQKANNLGLTGICFSGGGIRSATFNLGILQGLAQLGLLRCFDYLSTVSGGGYVHQWLAAWTKRTSIDEVEKQLIPLPEYANPGNHPEPIRWLRRYSNYLTPQIGLLTADTWVAFAIWLRNTLLNQIILISGLLALVFLPHFLAEPKLIPHESCMFLGLAAGVVTLWLLAIYFIGRELWSFVLHGMPDHSDSAQESLGQSGVQFTIVAPLFLSAVLLTLLFPSLPPVTLGVDLLLLLFGLALMITFAGGTPLSYLKTHPGISQFNSVSEFWNLRPKCWAHVKFALAVLGLIVNSLIATIAGAASVIGILILAATYLPLAGGLWWRIVLTTMPPLLMAGPLVMMLVLVGLLGRTFRDSHREWLSRIAAWMGLAMLLWFVSVGLSLFGAVIVKWLVTKIWIGLPVVTTWAAGSLAGLLAAKSPNSSGAKSDKAATPGLIEFAALVGPFVFIFGLLLLMSAVAEYTLQYLGSSTTYFVLFYAALLLICVLSAWRIDINEFSWHAFYRNRLTRCYLGASRTARDPNPFTGFDDKDADVAVCDLVPKTGYLGPMPIFCTALNLTFGDELAWQERKAASFFFSPLYSGYDVPWTTAKGIKDKLRFNGFVRTVHYAYPETGVHINTAAAISGAALSPNMGYHTSPAASFLLTLFSVRLGWWLRNPRKLSEDGTQIGRPNYYPRASPHFSLFSLGRELLGRTSDSSNYVYLSDGGHFDNMGLYELVRRHCRFIVICDSEDDKDLKFEGIGMAIRKSRIDFGAEVDLDLTPLQRKPDSEYSCSHCVVGTVRYPDDPDSPGIVVYIKSSLTGDEPADVLNYKKHHPVFPHDSTTDQWFSESQFESYRRLGHHVAYSVFEPGLPEAADQIDRTQPRTMALTTWGEREQYFNNLRCVWWAPTSEMETFSTAHTKSYETLLTKIRVDMNLPGLFTAISTGKSDWTTGRSPEQREYAVQFSSELIEFIWMVHHQLNLMLPEKRDHPYAQGWVKIFRRWATVDIVRQGWERYRDSYSSIFRRFVESDAIGLPR